MQVGKLTVLFRTEMFDLSASPLQACKEMPMDKASTIIGIIQCPIEGESHPLSLLAQYKLNINK